MKSDVMHEIRQFTNVRELIEWAAETHKDRVAYSFKPDPQKNEITKITFKELRNDVRALSSKLISMGCSGKHCVLIGKLSYEWAVTYYSVLSAGGVLVPLDRDWLAADLADTAAKADAKFLFCDEDVAEKGATVAESTSLLEETVYLNAKKEERTLRSFIEEGKDIFHKSRAEYFNTPIDPMRLSLLVFTSGTTGKGKGVMLSQDAILSDIASVIPYVYFGSKSVGVLPPHHTFGSTVTFLGHTIIGCEVYISSGLRYIQKELKEQQPEHLVLVPLYLETFYRKIMANVKDQGKEGALKNLIKISNGLRKTGIDARAKLFSSIRAAFGGKVNMIVCGGAPLNNDILAFYENIGITVINGYGITECAPVVSVNHFKNVVPGSIGNPLDICEVKISEPNEDGEGEICVKGRNVMLGYYNDKEATAEAIDQDGYFKTGDYGKFDENGILYITGRKKNLIILSNGKNVYPEEIESEIIAVPGVLEVIVYEGQSKKGMAHNTIVAEVFPDMAYIEKNGIEDIKAYLKKYVDEYNKTAVPYKKIGLLKVRKEEFPKNTLKKIMRFKLDMSID